MLRTSELITDTEAAILLHIACGKMSKEIAKEVRMSIFTVESYIKILMAKLCARTRAHLVARAVSGGVLTLEDLKAGLEHDANHYVG